jgi:hypothetical protein
MSGAASPGDDASAGRVVYSLGSSPAERDRLRRQSGELRGHSALLLDRVGIAEGWRAIDLACGPSGILDLLAGRVGPAARVVGLDFEPANVALMLPHLLFLAWGRKPDGPATAGKHAARSSNG